MWDYQSAPPVADIPTFITHGHSVKWMEDAAIVAYRTCYSKVTRLVPASEVIVIYITIASYNIPYIFLGTIVC